VIDIEPESSTIASMFVAGVHALALATALDPDAALGAAMAARLSAVHATHRAWL
jgi:hypothetical protein